MGKKRIERGYIKELMDREEPDNVRDGKETEAKEWEESENAAWTMLLE